jgi:hypothetical protein
MVDATISRVRMRDLACLGRCRPWRRRFAPSPRSSASQRQTVTDATSIADGLPSRPRAASSRPGAGDLVSSTITSYRNRVSPRFVPASVAELQRLGLFASLPGEALGRVADGSARDTVRAGLPLVPPDDDRVHVLLSGLGRSPSGVARPGDVVTGGAAVTGCVVVRIDRDVFDELVAPPS